MAGEARGNGGYRNYDAVMGYAESIVSGKKTACVELKQAAERFFRDVQNPLFDFRPASAEFVIQIIENTIVHVKGTKTGKPFLLEPWEKFICYNIAGFFLAGTEERRFKEVFIFIPRKNGKTPFASLRLGMATKSRSGPSMTLISWMASSPSTVTETTARRRPSCKSLRILISVMFMMHSSLRL